MIFKYLAKPDQSYDDHINAAYRAWKTIVAGKSGLINRTGRTCGFDPDRFLQSSLLTVVLHDLGKNILEFQRMMQIISQGRHPNQQDNYRHEIVSYSCALEAGKALEKQEGSLLSVPFPIEACAILGHHKPINNDFTAFKRELASGAVPKICDEGMLHAKQLASEIFAKEGFNLPDFRCPKGNPIELVRELIFHKFSKFYDRYSDPDILRSTYALLKGILHYSDWHGSAGVSINYALHDRVSDLLGRIETQCMFKGIRFSGLRPFQQACASTIGHCIVIAPTGSGKTEAGLLWALRNLEDMGGGKLIYLLPTMVTANSIYYRLREFFGKTNVGLTHSTAALLFAEEEEDRTLVRHALFDKTFMSPVTVATVDQLLFSGFNIGKWPVVESNVMNSVIIIDEIHAYDPWTLGLIIEAIRHFTKYGTRFMIMSATLPRYILEILTAALPNASIIRDEALLNSARNSFLIVDAPIEKAVDDVIDAVDKGARTMVVVNSVATCQELYNIFKNRGLNPVCYHSKFTLRDRDKKEKAIESETSRLLIATQVVEVSLDIDFDLMFTECAPPDAIVQRAGRVNRRREKENTCISIYQPSRVSEKIYDPDQSGLLQKSFQAFRDAPVRPKEEDLISLVEFVYKGRNIAEDGRFIEAIGKYSQSQSQLMAILDNPQPDPDFEVTRKVDYPQVSVIPLIFRDEIRARKPWERRWYEVKMPTWYVKKHREVEDDVIYCDMKYDSEIGARFIDTPELGYILI